VPPPFLLLQSRDPTDLVRDLEVAGFAQALGCGVADIGGVDLLARAPSSAEIGAARGVLLGGSGDYSVLDPYPWVTRAIDALATVVVPSGTPTFASCFGFQLLVRALGGTMVRDPANRELGSIDVDVTAAAAHDALFAPLPARFVAQAGHTDRAEAAPPGTVVLASTRVCPVQAFRVAGRAVWATQFHPEIDERAFARRWLAYAANYPPSDLPPGTPLSVAPFLRALRRSPEATAILARFAARVAAR
jgi:GMP synthase (glutamine-hydrolysing)